MSRKKLQQANELHARGEVPQAAAVYRRILKFEPANAAALHALGMLEAGQGNFGESLRLFERLVRLYPQDPAVRNNFANALRASGARAAAVEQYEEAVRLRPGHAQAWCNRGAVLDELGRQEEALASLDQALRIEPDNADARYNRGNVLHDLGRHEEALGSYAQALEIAPDFAAAWCSRGDVLAGLERYAEALASYDRAVGLRPDHAEAWCQRGGTLNEMKRPAAALQSCERAIALEPGHFGGWWNAANACFRLGRHAEALDHYRKALSLKPDIDYGPGQCLHEKMILCDWEGLGELRGLIEKGVAEGRRVAMPFVAQVAAFSAELQKACAEIHVAELFPSAASASIRGTSAGSSGRIRIGYVSGDFRNHPVGHQVRGLAKYHDRSAFEVIGLSLRRDDADPGQQSMRADLDQFHDLSDVPGAEAVAKIRAMALDVAVDLQGHMDGRRMELFAARIAAVQVNFLCPGTSGAPFVDYILADGTVIPANRQGAYRENLVALPDSFFITDYRAMRLTPAPPRAEQDLPAAGFVFASFCESYKISPSTWDVWMRLLRALPESVLWLGIRNPVALENLRREAAARGVAPERLVIAKFTAQREDHLSRLATADLCLDTPGYNGHTTTADALWAGVPVLATLGDGFSARVAASQLQACGLPELIADSVTAYEALALELARSPDRLAALRARLAANRQTRPLFDTQRSVRHVESAFEGMLARHRQGMPAQSFCVAPA